MKNAAQNLLTTIAGRPVLVWGARMTGIGFLRFAKTHGVNVVGFVDSDAALAGWTISGLPIDLPDVIPSLKKKHQDLVVLVAVSIKEDEIAAALKEFGMPDGDIIRYSGFCGAFFTIDVAGTCNLRCPSCAYTVDGIKNPMGLMPFDDFQRIMEKVVDETDLVSHVCLYSWGEPLLHPELGLFIEHLHSLGIAAAVSTHLSIPSQERIEKMIKADPDFLKISVSGFYPGAYNTTHTGGDIELVKSNLRLVRILIDKYQSSMFVDVNYHMYRNNIGEDLEKMKELCAELGFIFSPCYANVTPVERLIDYAEGRPDAAMRTLEDLLLVGVDKGLEIAAPYNNQPCRFRTNQVNINWDRSVSLCCVCFERKTSTICDDFLAESLAEITQKKENHPMCKKCMPHAIPPYLLGVNQKEWEKEARKNRAPRDVSAVEARPPTRKTP